MNNVNDILGYSDLKIVQNRDYFSFSLDSIILANYCNIRLRDKKIVDFCSGNCVVPIILSKRCDKKIEGVELQKSVYELGLQSIKLNHLEDQISFYNMDVKEFSKDPYRISQYDLVLCNPPYFKNEERSTKNLSFEKMIARHEITLTLDELCKCANLILKDNGCFTIVHRTERLVDIIDTFRKYHIEPKRIKFIYETTEKESFLMLIDGQKMGKPGLKIDKPLILYDKSGNMTEEYSKLQTEVIK
ncbi:MAG: tRNA1(Val) (adenine(37)-N6)-methyltransferase [Bacilli bacterium]|nr:tRNA1(Val) (adenine(37)-N6)-methyltransferase [Bacilli bacterium]